MELDELIKSARLCSGYGHCNGCLYDKDSDEDSRCDSRLLTDLADALERFVAKCRQLRRERDALLHEIVHCCSNCRYYEVAPTESPCSDCLSSRFNDQKWEWRGVQDDGKT